MQTKTKHLPPTHTRTATAPPKKQKKPNPKPPKKQKKQTQKKQTKKQQKQTKTNKQTNKHPPPPKKKKKKKKKQKNPGKNHIDTSLLCGSNVSSHLTLMEISTCNDCKMSLVRELSESFCTWVFLMHISKESAVTK